MNGPFIWWWFSIPGNRQDESIHLFQCWFVWMRCFYWCFEHRALFLEVYYLRYCGFFPSQSGLLPSVSLLGIPATRGCNGHDYGGSDVLKFYFVLFYFIYFVIFNYIILFYFLVWGSRFHILTFLEPFFCNFIPCIHHIILLKMKMIYSNYQATIIFKVSSFQIIKAFIYLFIFFLWKKPHWAHLDHLAWPPCLKVSWLAILFSCATLIHLSHIKYHIYRLQKLDPGHFVGNHYTAY